MKHTLINKTLHTDNKKDDRKDIITVRKNDLEIVIQLMEMDGRWRAYQWNGHQCVNWLVTLGRWFPSRSDALQFIRQQGYAIDDTQSE